MSFIFCKNGCLPTRAVVGLMIFTACFMCYMLRVNMSINIIAMVEPTMKPDDGSHRENVAECIAINSNRSTSNNSHSSLSKLNAVPDYGPRYNWNSKIQGLILSSYFWGNILTSIPGGLLAERFGPTLTLGVSGFLSAVLTILTPWAATWHYAAVLTIRFILGIAGGVIYPSLHCLVSRWAPPNEKGKFTGALMGGTLGTMLTWPVLGSIIEGWGWNWGFFVPGIIAFVWSCLWMILVSDSPDTHNRISEEEKMYIVKSLGGSINKSKALPPYLKMFTSVPFWAINILHFGDCWGLFFLITGGPKYMSEVLGFDVGHSGILAGLPHLARMLAGFVFGCIGDTIRRRSCMSVTGIRRTFVTMSHLVPGLLLFAIIFTGCNELLSVTLITISLGLNGAATITNLQNNQDLAPNFAGSIYGIMTVFGGIAGFITPVVTGYITSENNGLHEWHIIFCISGSIYIASGIVFCIFGTGEEQPWNQIQNKTENQSEKPVRTEKCALNYSTEISAKNDDITETTKV